ncbi:MAG TPA: hypothetical protein VF024_14195 [Solirubrobacteraceae bacterium]
MSRAQIAGLALLSYPTGAREARGEEMLATLLDVSDGSRRRFGPEVAALARLGLRAGAASTASAGTRRLLADGLCLAGIWVMTLDVSTLMAQRARGMQDPLLAAAPLALLMAALAVALVGRDRVAGAGALAWTAWRLPSLWEHHPGIVNLAPEALPILCFCVMVLAPRQRTADVRRLGWLIVPATLVLALAPPNGEQSPLLLAYVALGAILVTAFVLAMLPTDPRLAIAGAVSLSTIGLQVVAVNHDGSAPAWLIVAAAPLVLAAATTRTRRLRRPAPL